MRNRKSPALGTNTWFDRFNRTPMSAQDPSRIPQSGFTMSDGSPDWNNVGAGGTYSTPYDPWPRYASRRGTDFTPQTNMMSVLSPLYDSSSVATAAPIAAPPEAMPAQSFWNRADGLARQAWDKGTDMLSNAKSSITGAFDNPITPFEVSAFQPGDARMNTNMGAWVDPANQALGRYPMFNSEGAVDLAMPNATATGLSDTSGFWNNYGGAVTGGLNAAAGLLGAFNGYKQTQQAKEQFKFQRDAWNQQFNVQKKGINDQLRERQNYRNFVEPGKHLDTDAYLAKFGV